MKKIPNQIDLKNLPAQNNSFSPYDALESLSLQSRKIFSLIEKVPPSDSKLESLLQEIKSEIADLLSLWEALIFQKNNSGVLKEIQIISKSQLQENTFLLKSSSSEKLTLLQEQLRKSEESKQRVHSHHHDCLRILNEDIDEIVHDFKKKFKRPENIGNILEELFTKDELEQERQVFLGESRQKFDMIISKVDQEEEKWDMGIESDESSGPPLDLEGSAMLMYNRLHDLKGKINKFRQRDLELPLDETNGFNALEDSLPISLKSLSSCFELNKNSSRELIENPGPPFEIQSSVSKDEKEHFIVTLIDQEGTCNKEIYIEDFLSEDNSELKEKLPMDKQKLQVPSFKAKKVNDKDGFSIKLSPISKGDVRDFLENLSQDSSIIYNNVSSFISETSFFGDKKIEKENSKKIFALNRSKASEDSFLFPHINTPSDDQSFLIAECQVSKRSPLVPTKPICAPPKERLYLRGRSLLPKQNFVDKSSRIIIQCEEINVSSSPNGVKRLRMGRYKELTRPFIKIANMNMFPREPK